MKNHIFINQLGYMREGAKEAFLTGETQFFSLIDSVNNEAVFTGQTARLRIEPWGEKISVFDFSEVKLSGTFFLRASSMGSIIKSSVFDIADRPFAGLLSGIADAFFYNRCGVSTIRSDNPYAHSPCHRKPAEFAGGFHDKQDYSRSVYSHAVGMANLIYAILVAENRRTVFGVYEQIIDEIKHGITWMLSMQAEDGGVRSGIFAKDADVVSPETDTAEYTVGDPDTLTTVAFAALTALASGLFRGKDEVFSDKLKKAAVSAWIYYSENSPNGEKLYTNKSQTPLGNNTETDKSNIAGAVFWALCEMYAMTGSEDFLSAAKDSIPADVSSFNRFSPSGYGMCSVFLHPDGGDLDLRRKVMFALRVKADNLTSNSDKYYVTDGAFEAGSNITLMSDAMTLLAASAILKCDDYRNTALRNISYIMGANPLDKCFLTGFGENPVRHPHHAMSAINPDDDPVPGMVVFGANHDRLSDNFLKWQLPRSTPPAKSYGDALSSKTTNSSSMAAVSLLYFILSSL
jgi:endoglucanase